MKNNKKEFQKNAFTDLFSSTNDIQPIEHEEVKEEIIEEKEIKINKIEKKENKKTITIKKNYNLPMDLVEDIEKIVYMDRDLENNTDLVIKAIKEYLNSEKNKALLEEYKTIKGE